MADTGIIGGLGLGSSSVIGGLGMPGAGATIKKDGGLFGDITHVLDVATQPLENLGKDIGTAAVGMPLGLYAIGRTAITNPAGLAKYAEGIVKQYEDYYGHDVLHHLWDHPLQPILDGLTLATGGLAGAAKVGQVAGVARLANLSERAVLTTRSPALIHTGEGPVIERLSSNRPLTKMRQQVVNKMQRHILAFDAAGNPASRAQLIARKLPGVSTELKHYGKAIGDENIVKALRNSTPMHNYLKARKKLSDEEAVALDARSMDIHPTNLAEFWQGTTNGDQLTPEVHELMLNPTAKMIEAEGEARAVSQLGAELLKSRGVLSHESEIDRPGRFKAQVEELLGHPVDSIHDDPYYIPHTTGAMRRKGSHPMEQVGGGKALPRDPGSTKQNLGILFGAGKLDLGADVLGPEFLRRVKWVKFHGIHEGLRRGAWRVTWEELHNMGDGSGRPPKDFTFLRTNVTHKESDATRVALRKARERNARNPNFHNAQEVQRLEQDLFMYESGRRPDPQHFGPQKIPFSIRGEGEHEANAPRYDPADIPDSTDLQRSNLADGFSTTDLAHAYQDDAGRYFLIPKSTARAATGEFTRMSDFMYVWARRPLRIWRAALLGLRPAFFVNNLIGNSLMYSMKRGGTGAVRNLFMAMRESHPDRVLKQLLKDPATPPEVRAQLMAEFYPEALGKGDGTPPPPSGHTRMYRGEGTTRVKDVPEWMADLQGRWFTTDLDKATRYAKERNGEVSYVDIPDSMYADLDATAPAPGMDEQILPHEMVDKAQPYTAPEGGAKGTAVERRRNLPEAQRGEDAGYERRKRGRDTERPTTILPGTPAYEYLQDFYRTNYPEQMSGGTFGGTQSPSTEGLLRGAVSKGGQPWETTTGFLPRVTAKVAEENLRRGLIRGFIEESPEFKALWKSMPRESRNFLAAARKLHEGESGARFQELISRQVDESLGNYTRLSPFERNVLRNTFPFYAWYRAILKTTLHLGIDNPVRAQALYTLGQIGSETMMNWAGALPLPSYLQGSIPLGKGPNNTTRLLATNSLNPWATLNQLARGATNDLGELGINPFLIGALEGYRKLASGPGGTTRGVSVQALVSEMMSTIVMGLPPTAQVFPKKGSKLYPNRGYVSAWEAWAGLPLKEANRAAAAEYAKAGQ